MRPLAVFGLLLLAGCAIRGAVDWAGWAEAHRAAGLMRVDRSPADAPFDNATLARNFRTIAFEVEEDPFDIGEVEQRADASKMLQRWESPIVYVVHSTERERRRVEQGIAAFAGRLTPLTGVSFRRGLRLEERGPDDPVPNLNVFVLPENVAVMLGDLEEDGARMDAAGREFVRQIADFIRTWDRTIGSPCAGQVYVGKPAADGEGVIFGAIVLIRAGLPDDLLITCIEEEIAQTMGLLNDNQDVRPSIFNDDQEFALLTTHDEYLLRILYDARLRPGMRPAEAEPIVARIITELRPDR